MKYFCLAGILFAFLLTLAGCDKSDVRPQSITLEQLPPALDKAFAKAAPETKEIAGQISAALQAQDFPKAYAGFQTLAGKSGLNQEQTSILTRGMLCVNTLLQSAQSNGDPKAAETLRLQRLYK